MHEVVSSILTFSILLCFAYGFSFGFLKSAYRVQVEKSSSALADPPPLSIVPTNYQAQENECHFGNRRV